MYFPRIWGVKIPHIWGISLSRKMINNRYFPIIGYSFCGLAMAVSLNNSDCGLAKFKKCFAISIRHGRVKMLIRIVYFKLQLVVCRGCSVISHAKIISSFCY